MPGVEGVFDHNDVPGSKRWGPVIHDEEPYAVEKVVFVGQIIATVVADTEFHARRAARAVRMEYEDLPAIISIDDAIAAGTYRIIDNS